MGTLNVMDRSGHSSHPIDPNDRLSVEEADKLFNELLDKGYLAAERPGDGKGDSTVTRKLNPQAETVLYPPLVGG